MLKLWFLVTLIALAGCLGLVEDRDQVPRGDAAPGQPGDACFLDDAGAYHDRPVGRLTALAAWQRIEARDSLQLHWAQGATDTEGTAESWTFGVVAEGLAKTVTVRADWSLEPRHPSSDRRCPLGEIHVVVAGTHAADEASIEVSALGNASSSTVAWLDAEGWRTADGISQLSMFEAVANSYTAVPDDACLVFAAGKELPGGWVERSGAVVGVRLPDALGSDGRANRWQLTFTDGREAWSIELEGGVITTSQDPGPIGPCPPRPGIDSSIAAEAFGGSQNADSAYVEWAGTVYRFTMFHSDTVMTLKVDDQTGELR